MSLLKIKDREYFKKYLANLSTTELLALMQAIAEFSLEMTAAGKISLPKRGSNQDVT